MRLSVYRLVHVTGLASCVNTCVVARVRAHRRRGMRRRTSASFLLGSTTTLRTYIFPGGSPTFATIIPVAAAPTRERANVSPLSAFLLGVSALDDHARQQQILSPHVFSPRFSTNGGNASCGAFVSRLVSVRFPRKLVSRTNRSIVNAGIGPPVSFQLILSIFCFYRV